MHFSLNYFLPKLEMKAGKSLPFTTLSEHSRQRSTPAKQILSVSEFALNNSKGKQIHECSKIWCVSSFCTASSVTFGPLYCHEGWEPTMTFGYITSISACLEKKCLWEFITSVTHRVEKSIGFSGKKMIIRSGGRRQLFLWTPPSHRQTWPERVLQGRWVFYTKGFFVLESFALTKGANSDTLWSVASSRFKRRWQLLQTIRFRVKSVQKKQKK